MLLNTGESISIHNKETVANFQINLIQNSDIKLKAFKGTSISTLGIVETAVFCGDLHIDSFTFVALDHGSNVMGINLLETRNFAINIPSS